MPKTSLVRGRARRVLTLVGTLALLATLAVPVQAVLITNGSTFDAKDGNLLSADYTGTPSITTTDWCLLPTTGATCTDTAPGFKSKLDKPTGQQDDSIGSKEDDPIPSVGTGSIPNNKSDLTRMFIAHERASNGHIFAYLAWERVQDPTGTTLMDFEFNRNKCVFVSGAPTADSQCTNNNVTPARTAGDLLIEYGLAAGSTTPSLAYYKWIATGSRTLCEAANATPCWGKRTVLDPSLFEASVNVGSVVDPILLAGDTSPRTLSPRTFGEAAIDLTNAGLLQSTAEKPCTTFGSVYLKSRSSDTFTSQLKDFIAPATVDVSNCGIVKITKVADPSTTSMFSFGVDPVATEGGSSFTLNGTNVGQTKTLGIFVPAGSSSQSITVTESGPASGYSVSSITCLAGGDPYTLGADGKSVTIDSTPDKTTECTFTNTKSASISVTKDASPAEGTDFDFTKGGAFSGTLKLDEGDSDTVNTTETFSGLAPGTYTVTESAKAGWTLDSITCPVTGSNGSSASIDLANGRATITLKAGDAVACTFGNSRDTGTIKVVKDFSANAPSGASVDLQVDGNTEKAGATDGQDTGAVSVNTGTHSVGEVGVSGTPLSDYTSSISCVKNGATTPFISGPGTSLGGISVDKGDAVVCTITNDRKQGSIELQKVWSGPAGTATLAIGTQAGGDDVASDTLEGDGGIGPESVNTGTYYLSESVSGPEGSSESSLDCVNNAAAGDSSVQVDEDGGVAVGEDDEIVCTFTNTKVFKVIVLVCDTTNDQLYASDVAFEGGQHLRSLGTGELEGALDDLEAEICNLGGATHIQEWSDTHTHTATVDIGDTPKPVL